MMHTVTLRWEDRKSRFVVEVGAVDRGSAIREAARKLREKDGHRPVSIVVEAVREGRLGVGA